MAKSRAISATGGNCAGAVLLLLLATGLAPGAQAQVPGVQVPVPGACATPASERGGEMGCYVDAIEPLGRLDGKEVYWHIYDFASRADAEAAKPPHGTVVEAFGKAWLYSIGAVDWHPATGERVAVIGPLVVDSGKQYTARYLEASFAPGMRAKAHEHSGPEAFYVVSGAQCLETSDGMLVSHAGESAVAPEGSYMTVKGFGKETRRALVVVLHDTARPWQTLTTEWTPKGLCPD